MPSNVCVCKYWKTKQRANLYFRNNAAKRNLFDICSIKKSKMFFHPPPTHTRDKTAVFSTRPRSNKSRYDRQRIEVMPKPTDREADYRCLSHLQRKTSKLEGEEEYTCIFRTLQACFLELT
jgi:hypothetical protein